MGKGKNKNPLQGMNLAADGCVMPEFQGHKSDFTKAKPGAACLKERGAGGGRYRFAEVFFKDNGARENKLALHYGFIVK